MYILIYPHIYIYMYIIHIHSGRHILWDAPPPDPPIPVGLRPPACSGPEARSSRATNGRLSKEQRSKATKQSKEAKQRSKAKKHSREAKQSKFTNIACFSTTEVLDACRWIPLEKIVCLLKISH